MKEYQRVKIKCSWTKWIHTPDEVNTLCYNYFQLLIFLKQEVHLPLQKTTSDCGVLIGVYAKMILLSYNAENVHNSASYATSMFTVYSEYQFQYM